MKLSGASGGDSWEAQIHSLKLEKKQSPAAP